MIRDCPLSTPVRIRSDQALEVRNGSHVYKGAVLVATLLWAVPLSLGRSQETWLGRGVLIVGRRGLCLGWERGTGHRYKQIVGDHLRSRTPDRQRTEAMIGVAILNRMAELGMPESRAFRI